MTGNPPTDRTLRRTRTWPRPTRREALVRARGDGRRPRRRRPLGARLAGTRAASTSCSRARPGRCATTASPSATPSTPSSPSRARRRRRRATTRPRPTATPEQLVRRAVDAMGGMKQVRLARRRRRRQAEHRLGSHAHPRREHEPRRRRAVVQAGVRRGREEGRRRRRLVQRPEPLLPALGHLARGVRARRRGRAARRSTASARCA